ncbi:hypothetical protein [Brasilonema bromeliae]|nr:hypothetical protein [Brasilonema bromeliae]
MPLVKPDRKLLQQIAAYIGSLLSARAIRGASSQGLIANVKAAYLFF